MGHHEFLPCSFPERFPQTATNGSAAIGVDTAAVALPIPTPSCGDWQLSCLRSVRLPLYHRLDHGDGRRGSSRQRRCRPAISDGRGRYRDLDNEGLKPNQPGRYIEADMQRTNTARGHWDDTVSADRESVIRIRLRTCRVHAYPTDQNGWGRLCKHDAIGRQFKTGKPIGAQVGRSGLAFQRNRASDTPNALALSVVAEAIALGRR